jgi:LPS export ABC transporter protein LptC
MRPTPGLRLAGGIVLISVVLCGCESTDDSAAPAAPPFVFRSLELRQKKADGSRDWDLNSPEARYEFSRRLVRARNPSGLLYNKNKPTFTIKAQTAVVFNDGQEVLLEGDVQLQQLTGQKVLIRGDRLRWTPGRSLLVIDQRPQADDQSNRLRASSAQLQQDSQDLTLMGVVQLEQWGQARKPGVSPNSVLRTQKAIWNLGDGALQAQGPVLGQRREKQDTLQQLQASRLSGNTKEGLIDLIEPVRVQFPKRKGLLNALTTRWNFKKETLSSESPFDGRLDRSNIEGRGFLVDLKKSTVKVSQDCRLQQPGEQLEADHCEWNWSNDAVLAKGNVVLRRKSNNQVTRSQVLRGKVGRKGTVIFSAPGDKVRSELSLDEGRSRSTKKTRQPAPVSF